MHKGGVEEALSCTDRSPRALTATIMIFIGHIVQQLAAAAPRTRWRRYKNAVRTYEISCIRARTPSRARGCGGGRKRESHAAADANALSAREGEKNEFKLFDRFTFRFVSFIRLFSAKSHSGPASLRSRLSRDNGNSARSSRARCQFIFH